jgi:hypothetical protein
MFHFWKIIKVIDFVFEEKSDEEFDVNSTELWCNLQI